MKEEDQGEEEMNEMVRQNPCKNMRKKKKKTENTLHELHGSTSKHFLVLSKGYLTLQPHVFIELGDELLSSLIYSPKGQLHCFGRHCSFGSCGTWCTLVACGWLQELDWSQDGLGEELVDVYRPMEVVLASVHMRCGGQCGCGWFLTAKMERWPA